jgi:hypothetical protein
VDLIVLPSQLASQIVEIVAALRWRPRGGRVNSRPMDWIRCPGSDDMYQNLNWWPVSSNGRLVAGSGFVLGRRQEVRLTD